MGVDGGGGERQRCERGRVGRETGWVCHVVALCAQGEEGTDCEMTAGWKRSGEGDQLSLKEWIVGTRKSKRERERDGCMYHIPYDARGRGGVASSTKVVRRLLNRFAAGTTRVKDDILLPYPCS